MPAKFHYLIFLSLLLCSCPPNKNLVVIQHVNFFDGDNYQTDVNIVIDGNIISDITTKNNWPTNSVVINGRGKTIIPPLLNAHVHVWSESSLKEALHSGVFALFDMHTTDEVANALRQYRDSSGYAYYYSSGPGATVPGGHGTEYGITVPTIDSSVSAEQFVKDRIKNNADYIKILREPSMPTVNFEQTLQVIITAHQYSKLCVAHISNVSDAMQLYKQGIDGFMHIWFDKKMNKEQLDSLVKSKVFMVPTLYVIEKLLEAAKEQGWSKDLLTFDEVMQEVKKLYDAGVPILAGTDAPNFGFNYGSDLFIELKLLHQAGIPATDVLKAATSNIYKCFKIKEFGKLKKGATASFILINGNPIDNFDDIDKIETIWQKGKQLSN